MSLKTTLNALGDAVRGKAGVTGALTLEQMTDAVNGISVGTDTSDATAAASDILSGKTAYAGGVKLTGTIPSKAAATITPGTADQTIAAGWYLRGAQTIKGDANLLAENIAKDVSIFGVTGTHKGGGQVASGTLSMSQFKSNYIGSTKYYVGGVLSGLAFVPRILVWSTSSFGTYNPDKHFCITDESGAPIRVGYGDNSSYQNGGAAVYAYYNTYAAYYLTVSYSSSSYPTTSYTAYWYAFG